MKAEFIDPFIQAAYSVINTLIQDMPERGPLSLRTSTFTTQQVTIMAGVNGHVRGIVLYGMSVATAQNIASAMIGESIEGPNDMVWSAVSELGNIITGNAVQLLYNAGYQCDITPPTVLRGVDLDVSTFIPALVVPLSTKFGHIEINAALQIDSNFPVKM